MKKLFFFTAALVLALTVTTHAQTAPVKYDSTALKAFTGNYNIPTIGQRSKLIIKDGKLLSIGTDNDFELTPTVKENVFEINGGEMIVTFLFDDKKKVTKATVKTNDGNEFEAVKEN